MTKKRRKTIRRIVFTAIAILIMLGSIRFLIDTCRYLYLGWDISSIESNANQGYWTANGRVTWDDSDVQSYDKAVAKKEEFIENSDVAKFHYYSAFSTTGQVFRILATLANIWLFYNSVDVLFAAFKCLIRNLNTAVKKVILIKKAYNRKKSRI